MFIYVLSAGTFISVDQIINNMDAVASSELDIFHTVYQLRKQRCRRCADY